MDVLRRPGSLWARGRQSDFSRAAIEGKLSCVTRIYEAQHPEHWRGCAMVGFPRKCAREAMRELRAARVVVLPIGHRSRYIRSLADEWRIIEEQS